MNISRKFLFTLAATALVAGCSNSSSTSSTSDGTDAASNISESAMSEAGAQSSATEGATSPSLMSLGGFDDELQSMDFLDPKDANVHAESACRFSTARSSCSSDVDTINWNGCTVGLATITGSWTETWSSGACPGPLANSESVTRTSPSGEIVNFATGFTLTTSTAAHTAYDGTSIPSSILVMPRGK